MLFVVVGETQTYCRGRLQVEVMKWAVPTKSESRCLKDRVVSFTGKKRTVKKTTVIFDLKNCFLCAEEHVLIFMDIVYSKMIKNNMA